MLPFGRVVAWNPPLLAPTKYDFPSEVMVSLSLVFVLSFKPVASLVSISKLLEP